ncbi:hypothetical protein [Micrococcus luteus]|nr:hypothetical protein [Micrococcus luteus]
MTADLPAATARVQLLVTLMRIGVPFPARAGPNGPVRGGRSATDLR